ncbi:hypothetical protein [Botrimarina mediterranea]|uniref:hypothetical protein n=1 Tax=Botrimarina mediterranea TaxID=2528022 RepID=UPI00118976BD|nr:hypothetical protein K2D_16600 [Planctomycetes bacterium K2D]
MSYLDAYTITCGHCGHEDKGAAFEPSMADECFCPACGEMFICDTDDEDEEDEE